LQHQICQRQRRWVSQSQEARDVGQFRQVVENMLKVKSENRHVSFPLVAIFPIGIFMAIGTDFYDEQWGCL
jgi:hypothetical protein